MLDVIWWLLTVEAIGLAAFPLAYFLLPRLTDRGYAVSKPLGILLIGYASWILSVTHILPSVRLSVVVLLLVMGGLSGWYAWRRRRELLEFVGREKKLLIAIEAIFLLFFVGWVSFRAYDPAIDHTEQPMDFAFLNASIQSRVGPPEDPWFSGESISYYYFGYWTMGTITRLTAIPSKVSYNLSMALIPSLAAMGIFGLVYNMGHAQAVRKRLAALSGLVAAGMLGLVANLEGVLEFMRANGMGSQGFWDWIRIDGLDGPSASPAESWVPGDFWWWFRATRVINTYDNGQGIDYTIQEFPFFSFMLGDLHPHVMAIPFGILFVAMSWNYLRSPDLVTFPWSRSSRSHGESSESMAGNSGPESSSLDATPAGPTPGVSNPWAVRGYATLLAMALVLGGLGFTNMWDLPTFAVLFVGIAALKTYSDRGSDTWTMLKGTIPIAVLVIGLSGFLFLPYYLEFKSSLTGIYVVPTTTRPVHLFLVWGLYLVVVAPFVIVAFWRTTVTHDWFRLTTIALLAGFLPYLAWAFLSLEGGGTTAELWGRFFHVLPFALLISTAVYSAMWAVKQRGIDGTAFALFLAALGLLLIMGSELLFIGDTFGNRMNTVFKLYYQAWILLAVVSGFALYYWHSLRASLSGWRRSLTTLWAGIFVVLLAGSIYYPPAAIVSKGESFGGGVSLDGLAFVAKRRLAEYEAIEYLKKNIQRDTALIEAVGEYNTSVRVHDQTTIGGFDAGLISRSTGMPTVLNWPGHERQWRGATDRVDTRDQDVTRIYQTLVPEEAKSLMAKYDVTYVYVGPREREKYGADGLEKFRTFMEPVFSQDDVVIYRTKR